MGSPLPELPTTETWREIMRTARKTKGLTQGDLGKLVGVTQTVISDLETGVQARSSVVLAICAALDIELPNVLGDDELHRWLELGRRLRQKSKKRFAKWVGLLDEEVDA